MKALKKAIRLAAAAAMLTSTVLTPVLSPAAAKPVKKPARPNIVLIVLDDVGFSDLGAFGSEIRTPHIDALAKTGLRYNRFDTKAICSSTRAALLTGRNNQTVGMEDLASYAARARSARLSRHGSGARRAGLDCFHPAQKSRVSIRWTELVALRHRRGLAPSRRARQLDCGA